MSDENATADDKPFDTSAALAQRDKKIAALQAELAEAKKHANSGGSSEAQAQTQPEQTKTTPATTTPISMEEVNSKIEQMEQDLKRSRLGNLNIERYFSDESFKEWANKTPTSAFDKRSLAVSFDDFMATGDDQGIATIFKMYDHYVDQETRHIIPKMAGNSPPLSTEGKKALVELHGLEEKRKHAINTKQFKVAQELMGQIKELRKKSKG